MTRVKRRHFCDDGPTKPRGHDMKWALGGWGVGQENNRKRETMCLFDFEKTKKKTKDKTKKNERKMFAATHLCEHNLRTLWFFSLFAPKESKRKKKPWRKNWISTSKKNWKCIV